MPLRRLIAVVAALLMVSMGSAQAKTTLRLSSADFRNGSRMPAVHASNSFGCVGKNVPPTLSWSGAPRQTRSFALTMLDVDVHPSPFVHWVVYNIPGSRRSLRAKSLHGIRQLVNSTGSAGYAGPCPPSGQTHHYVFTLYALSTSRVRTYSRLPDLLRGLKGHILAEAVLVGTFRHSGS